MGIEFSARLNLQRQKSRFEADLSNALNASAVTYNTLGVGSCSTGWLTFLFSEQR